MNRNVTDLRKAMRKGKLSRADVAALLMVSRATVDAWLKPPTNRSHRPMSDRHAELLRVKSA